jgi:sialidase-1
MALLLPVPIAGSAEIDQDDLFVSGRGGYHTYRIPALLACDNGHVLAFCEGRKSSPRDDGDIDLLLRRSPDGGKSWLPAEVVHEEGDAAPITIGNPCPIVDRRRQRVHLLFCRNNRRALHTFSNDFGKTWSRPREITGILRSFDFPWTRLGTGPGHGLQLDKCQPAGRLVVPLWLNTAIGRDYRSAVVLSDDGGVNWRVGGRVSGEIPNTNECMVFEFQRDGTWMLGLNMRARGTRVRTMSVSQDGGASWSIPKRIEDLPDPVCQASVLRLRTVYGAESLLLANPSHPQRRVNLTLHVSRDEGGSWSRWLTLHRGPSAYSDLARLPDGKIGCLYECGENTYHERLRFARFTPPGDAP